MTVCSWGKYPKVEAAAVKHLSWRHEKIDFDPATSFLAHGMGRSYGDSCLNEGGTLLMTRGLDRFVSFDPETGDLRVEAGVTLEEILRFALPRGYFLPASPGTCHVTVGGAIANDVHGKNHHVAGTFGCVTDEFTLLRSSGEILRCSRTENAGLFRATIGGLGLTGLILDAKIRLRKVRGPFLDVKTIQFGSLREFLQLSKELGPKYEYSVSWVDGTAHGAQLGRGLFMAGNHSDLTVEEKKEPFVPKLVFPCEAPEWLLNRATIRAFNELYWRKTVGRAVEGVQHYVPFFYPLDAIENWNRMYGKRGFFQYQCVLPFGDGEEACAELLRRISAYGKGTFLSVLKTFGDVESPGMLSFPRKGITLALDFANEGKETLDFLSMLDGVVAEAGGALYPAKDARMDEAMFARSCPRLEEFAKFKDPLFSSSLWRRLGEPNFGKGA